MIPFFGTKEFSDWLGQKSLYNSFILCFLFWLAGIANSGTRKKTLKFTALSVIGFPLLFIAAAVPLLFVEEAIERKSFSFDILTLAVFLLWASFLFTKARKIITKYVGPDALEDPLPSGTKNENNDLHVGLKQKIDLQTVLLWFFFALLILGILCGIIMNPR